MPETRKTDGVENRGRLATLVIAEAAVLAAAAAAMIWLDLGWAGPVIMLLLVAAFTFTLVRATESRAKAAGNFSPAMARYNNRMLIAGAIYVIGLFGAVWAHEELGLNGATAFLFAFAPSVGVLTMVWAMARLIADESDEYLRYRYIRASLFGLGGLLTLATVWGFFEQFDLVPHAPTWLAVPIFAIGLGLGNCLPSGGRE